MSEHEHNAHHEHHHGHHHDHEERDHGALPCDQEGHTHHHHADGSCCCEHHAAEFHGLNKVMAARLIVSAVLYLAGLLLPVSEQVEAVLMIAAAIIAGYDIVISAVKHLLAGKLFDEYFLMAFAAIAACIIGEYEEGAAVMVLYRIGETFQDYAIRHSRRTIHSLTGEDGNATEPRGGSTERFITKFSRIYTPVILVLALLVGVFLPQVQRGVSYSESVYRALSFLVLACPCAIVISVPLAYFAGIAAASKRGIYFKDVTSIDLLTKESAGADAFRPAELYGGVCQVFGDHDVVIRSEKDVRSKALTIAKKARRIAFENIGFVIAIKIAVLVLSVLGISSLWFAVFADSGVAILAVLNSLRAFYLR